MARSPYSASNLEVPPDPVEYALAPAQVPKRVVTRSSSKRRGLPPRYPPWLSMAVIFPVYALLGAEPGMRDFRHYLLCCSRCRNCRGQSGNELAGPSGNFGARLVPVLPAHLWLGTRK